MRFAGDRTRRTARWRRATTAFDKWTVDSGSERRAIYMSFDRTFVISRSPTTIIIVIIIIRAVRIRRRRRRAVALDDGLIVNRKQRDLNLWPGVATGKRAANARARSRHRRDSYRHSIIPPAHVVSPTTARLFPNDTRENVTFRRSVFVHVPPPCLSVRRDLSSRRARVPPYLVRPMNVQLTSMSTNRIRAPDTPTVPTRTTESSVRRKMYFRTLTRRMRIRACAMRVVSSS